MKKIKTKYNLLILLFLAVIVAFAINFPRYAIPIITLLYLISPIFFYIYYKLRKNKLPETLVTQAPTPAADDTPPDEEGEF